MRLSAGAKTDRRVWLVVTAVLVMTVVTAAVPATASKSADTAAAALAAVAVGPTDPDITFVGRWNTGTATGYVPQWVGAYLVTRFTGTTVKLDQRGAVNLYASIDGGPDVYYSGVHGTVNLTPAPLNSGTHTLRVSYRSGDAVFRGLTLDPGATVVAPRLSRELVEFVGDSITAGYLDSKRALSDYGWLTGELLGVRHTQIARSGYCLVSVAGCVGQRTQYFDLGSSGSTPWDFSTYQASAVVINLGTNDALHGVTPAAFLYAYTAFLKRIRAEYPNAAIFAMETFAQRYVDQTEAAVTARNDAGDANVYFVDTEGWLTTGADYVDVDLHPDDAGQLKVAERLAPIIAAKIGVPTP